MALPKIHFFTENITFLIRNKTKVKNWLKEVAQTENFTLKEINYIFCDDSFLLEINQTYLDHDTLTDIITFDHSSSEHTIEGEIYISIPRVEENAQELSLSFDEELRRVMAHGLLHLCGYKDKTDDEASLMRQKENSAIKVYQLF